MSNGEDGLDPSKVKLDEPEIPESPGGRPMGIPGLVFLAIYLVTVASFTVHGLIILWPPNLTQLEKEEQKKQAEERKREEEKKREAALITGATGTGGAAGGPSSVPGGAAGTATPNPAPAETETPPSSVRSEVEPVQTTAETCKALGQELRKYFGRKFCVSDEERLLMIVLLAGALGALVHALRSFSWYVGNRRMVWSWSIMYFVLPFLGATMAFVFYLVIRGGFFSPNASVDQTSPFGFAALAVLVGMFTNEAAQKLKDVATTVLAEAKKGKDHITVAPAISKIDPLQGKLAGGDVVTITGTGFAKEAVVKFGGEAATGVKVINDTTITAVTPPGKAPGPVPVEVINSGDLKASASFTYTQ